MKQTVGVILYDNCIFFEVALALELVAEKFRIVALTPDGSAHRASNGLSFSDTTAYKNFDLESCAGILVPGGDPSSVAENTDLMSLIQNANSKRKIIGAICAGPSILGKAAILKGKKIAHGYKQEQLDFLKEIFSEVILTDDPLVHDANILTAKPEFHIDFAVDFARRLDVLSEKSAPRLKNYYKGFARGKTRLLALAVIQNERGQLLLHQAFDSVSKEKFYRALGGGIEFGEKAKLAIQREIHEELNEEVRVGDFVGFLESIFTYEGHQGHELVVIHRADFNDKHLYERDSFEIIESGRISGKAVWKSVAEIESEGAKLYPQGFGELVTR